MRIPVTSAEMSDICHVDVTDVPVTSDIFQEDVSIVTNLLGATECMMRHVSAESKFLDNTCRANTIFTATFKRAQNYCNIKCHIYTL